VEQIIVTCVYRVVGGEIDRFLLSLPANPRANVSPRKGAASIFSHPIFSKSTRRHFQLHYIILL
jgi:hypothetical protein